MRPLDTQRDLAHSIAIDSRSTKRSISSRFALRYPATWRTAARARIRTFWFSGKRPKLALTVPVVNAVRLAIEPTSFDVVAYTLVSSNSLREAIIRLQRFQKLISDGGRVLSLSQIAELLHFSDASAFYRAFRRWTGRAPGEFRRTINPQSAIPRADSEQADYSAPDA